MGLLELCNMPSGSGVPRCDQDGLCFKPCKAAIEFHEDFFAEGYEIIQPNQNMSPPGWDQPQNWDLYQQNARLLMQVMQEEDYQAQSSNELPYMISRRGFKRQLLKKDRSELFTIANTFLER